MIMSDFVLGRKPVRERYVRDGKVTVSVYYCTWSGTVRYTGPVTQKANRSKPSIKYRIKVTAKGFDR